MILGIDIGGTNIKFGVVSESYDLIRTWSIPTEADKGDLAIVENIIHKLPEIQKEYPIDLIGVGSPGSLDCEKGICIRASNLPYRNTPIVSMISEASGIPARLINDANAAVYGELYAGTGQTYKNIIMVTLGTGVGGGIVIDGAPYSGRAGRAGEIGHMTLVHNGLPCPCGRKGCFEQYASVTALIRQTKEAIEQHPDSLLAQLYRDHVTGRSAFDAKEKGCQTAAAVIEQYADYLASGLTSLQNIFDPDALILGGAISGQGENLLDPIRRRLTKPHNLLISPLHNDAGVIGAAAAARQFYA